MQHCLIMCTGRRNCRKGVAEMVTTLFDQAADKPPAHLAGIDLAGLNERFAGASPQQVLRAAIEDILPDELALVSSFGADSAVLVHMVSRIAPDLPVLFVDTGRHFEETLSYQQHLAKTFGLTDVRALKPDAERVAYEDSHGYLHALDADLCCHIRKVEPLNRGLEGFAGWITGRKRFQTGDRADLAFFEADSSGIKVNPLALWGPKEVSAYLQAHSLPGHPLVPRGYLSIGCAPCTEPVKPGEDPRAGRWRGQNKTECGIHFGKEGMIKP